MDEEAMLFQIVVEARKEMLIAGLRKAINPKDTDLGIWKKLQEHSSRCIHYTIVNVRCNIALSASACSYLLWLKTTSSFSSAKIAIKWTAMHYAQV